jgi:16S rRNA (cytosine1402-N4)-methyltransferase
MIRQAHHKMHALHKPVLLKEVIKYLNVGPNKNFIDATLGAGGHAEEILKSSSPKGKLLGIERDPVLIKSTKKSLKKYQNRAIICRNEYSKINNIALENNFKKVDGVLYDLGLSSWHLEKSGRGFSFKKEEPLDMRFNPNQTINAADIINNSTLEELINIIKNYGEEKHYRRMAEAIIDARRHRRLETTNDLLKAITPVTITGKPAFKKGKIHPATKTFQALRIAVNSELDKLTVSLPRSLKLLRSGGRLAVITFHSLEAKIVKDFFRENRNEIKVIEKAVPPTLKEIKINPRARSAVLRVFEKI